MFAVSVVLDSNLIKEAVLQLNNNDPLTMSIEDAVHECVNKLPMTNRNQLYSSILITSKGIGLFDKRHCTAWET